MADDSIDTLERATQPPAGLSSMMLAAPVIGAPQNPQPFISYLRSTLPANYSGNANANRQFNNPVIPQISIPSPFTPGPNLTATRRAVSQVSNTTNVTNVTGGVSPYTAPPLLNTFSWMNQGSAAALQGSGPYTNVISIKIPDNASINWRVLTRPSPSSAPYRLIVALRLSQFLFNSQTSGVYFSDGTKLMGLEFLTQNGVSTLRVEKMNSVTSDNSTAAALNSAIFTIFGDLWLQLRNDGSKLWFDWSRDGCVFYNLYNENQGAFISPNVYGIGGIAITGTTQFVQTSIMSWQELAS